MKQQHGPSGKEAPDAKAAGEQGLGSGRKDQQGLRKHKGACHCGRVRFEIEAPSSVIVDHCTCSICKMSGFEHLIVEADHFKLVQGSEWLTTYRFGTKTAQHLFCRICGVKSFYVPRSHPDGFSVNFRCLDQSGFEDVQKQAFDGENWEQNIEALRGRTEG